MTTLPVQKRRISRGACRLQYKMLVFLEKYAPDYRISREIQRFVCQNWLFLGKYEHGYLHTSYFPRGPPVAI